MAKGDVVNPVCRREIRRHHPQFLSCVDLMAPRNGSSGRREQIGAYMFAVRLNPINQVWDCSITKLSTELGFMIKFFMGCSIFNYTSIVFCSRDLDTY